MAADPKSTAVGVDGNVVPGHVHRFATLQVGSERIAPAYIFVSDAPKSLLGVDFLRNHRVWISYPHGLLYIQPVPSEPSALTASPPSPRRSGTT